MTIMLKKLNNLKIKIKLTNKIKNLNNNNRKYN